MKISDNGIQLIKRFEGLRLNAYLCPAGVVTIGYGHTGNVKLGEFITNQKADELLISDLAKFEKHVNQYNDKYLYNFNQNQFDALVSFAFNIGSIKQLTANGTRTKTEIPNYIIKYTHANGKMLAGLVERRRAEKELYLLDNSSHKKLEQCDNSPKTPLSIPQQNTLSVQPLTLIARQVLNGEWGNGKERKERLEKAGYNYIAVQAIVNSMVD